MAAVVNSVPVWATSSHKLPEIVTAPLPTLTAEEVMLEILPPFIINLFGVTGPVALNAIPTELLTSLPVEDNAPPFTVTLLAPLPVVSIAAFEVVIVPLFTVISPVELLWVIASFPEIIVPPFTVILPVAPVEKNIADLVVVIVPLFIVTLPFPLFSMPRPSLSSVAPSNMSEAP